MQERLMKELEAAKVEVVLVEAKLVEMVEALQQRRSAVSARVRFLEEALGIAPGQQEEEE